MIQEAVIANLRQISIPERNNYKSVIFTDATFPNEIEVLTNLSKQLSLHLSTRTDTNFDVNWNCLHVTNYLSDMLSIPECRYLTASVAKIMEETCNFNEAVELYTKLLNSIDPATDIDKKDLLEVKDKIGGVLDYQEKYEEARQIFSEILDVKIQVFGMNHPSTLETQMNIISTLQELGLHTDAKTKFSDVEEGIKNIMDLKDPAALTAKYNFGCLLYSYLKYERALEFFQNVLDEYEKSLKPDQLSKLRTQSMVAKILSIQGKHNDAVTLYRNIIENFNELSFRDTLIYRKNYAHALYLSGSGKPELEKALAVYKEVLKDEETLNESQSQLLGTSVTKHNIASVLTDLGRFDEAIDILMNLVEVKVSEYGSDHPLTLDTMHYLAVTLRKQENYDESMKTYQLVLKLRNEELGACHPDTLKTKTDIGWAYFHYGKFKNAERIGRDVLSTKDKPDSDVNGTARTRLRRRIMPAFQFNRASDQSAGAGCIMLYEKSKKKLDELYSFTIRAVDTLKEDEDPDD